MKQKKQMEVSDYIFEAFNFTLPKNIPKEYQKGKSITGYVGSDHIIALKKENTYHRKKYGNITSLCT